MSQVRRLSAGTAFKVSCSTSKVKPKALKKEPESSVCSLSHIGDLYRWSRTPCGKRKGQNRNGGFNWCIETGVMVNPRDWPWIPPYSSVWIEWQVVMSKFL